MIEYLLAIKEAWIANGGDEPQLCTVCYEEACWHTAPKWPVSHLLNKLELDDKIWTRSNSSKP